MEKMKNFGLAIKELRKSKGLTLDQVSDFCKIKKAYLGEFEQGNFSFKSEIYIRLFLKSYIDYIDLQKSDSIMQEFDNLFNTSKVPELIFAPPSSVEDKIEVSEFEENNYNPKKIATIVMVVILIIFIYQFVINHLLSTI